MSSRGTRVSGSRFAWGTPVMTRGVAGLLEDGALTARDVDRCLTRHISGDWGTVSAEDKRANDAAIASGDRLVSAYDRPDGKGSIWVITEADRSATTVLLPDEY